MLIDAPFREQDKWGDGAYGASRGAGRKHKGVDVACYKDSVCLSVCDGTVTKIGYPYNPSDPKKGHLRYVEVTRVDGLRFRYFYITPLVKKGDEVVIGSELGVAQGLTEIYPGITDHIHFEVLKADGTDVNPHQFI